MAGEKDGGVPPVNQRMEVAIYRLQEAQIRLLYGRKASRTANYGWAVDVGDGFVEVTTKIYDPPMFLNTTLHTDIYPND